MSDEGFGHRIANGLDDVENEQYRQYELFGVQHHPDGTSAAYTVPRDAARDTCDWATHEGRLTWRHILKEEVMEAFAETDPGELRTELVQVAAVALSWVNDIDSREGQ